MDYSTYLDNLQSSVAKAQAEVEAAASDSRSKLQARIGQAHVAAQNALESANVSAVALDEQAQTDWARMRADAAARLAAVKTRVDHRSATFDANVAQLDAEAAEADAEAAIDYAEWAVSNAEYAILSAIDARLNADEKTAVAAAH